MHSIGTLACLINRHHPNRRKVQWNGKHFSGRCQNCGHKIVREGHRKWRLDHAALRYGQHSTPSG